MRKVRLGVCFLALMLMATVSFAAGPFFVGVEANFVKPSNMPTAFALSDPDTDSDPEGTIIHNEFSNELAPEVYFGWMTGAGGWIFFDLWQFDETNSETATNPTGGELWDILYHADESQDGFVGTASSDLTIDAQKFDFAYGRNAVEKDNLKINWMAGLRYASLDYSNDLVYDDTVGGDTAFMFLNSETDGIGIVGGLKGSYEFAENWMLSGGMSYAFLTGSTDNSNLAYDIFGTPSDPDNDISSSVDKSWSMFEPNCTLVWKVNDNFWVHAGMEFGQWNNAVGQTLFPDDVNEGFTENSNHDVAFDGFTFGATWAFGGDS